MSGNAYFDSGHGLLWREDIGMGFLNLTETPYDAAYFQKYCVMADTQMGVDLTNARVDLVNKFCNEGSLVDIGIGSGQFMDAIGGYGFDINPVAVKLLEGQQRFFNPYSAKIDCATFFDSFEHIANIENILRNITKFCFVSIPIFRDMYHVLSSRHFRPDEHCFYFTDHGFKSFMDVHGFNVVSQNTMETDLGREDIGTYVLCRQENLIVK